MRAPIHLPDCTDRRAEPTLTSRQRREIVRVLAQEGIDGLERWIEEEATNDPDIRERVEAERERLVRQAERKRRQLERDHAEERREREQTYAQRLDEMRAREDALRERLSQADPSRAPTRAELAEHSNLFQAAFTLETGEPSAWARFKRALYRVWLWIVETWARFWAWVRREDRDREEAPTLDLSGQAGLELDLYDLMASQPGVRVRVRERLSEQGLAERMRHWWRRMTGREDYSELAREIMARELEDAREAIEVEREREREQVRAQLEQVKDETAEERRERRSSLEELERRHQQRLDELEAQVESKPLEAVREELVDELEAAGLVTDEGTPTERLLERFSQLLYEDVQRALPRGGRVTPGAFLGGEGEYEKHPLRSLNERGHVALVDSVVRSRQNHPRVRHLYDSDLLVHREVRANTTHVVIIFDRSGSMEERGRFEAAKRVCLVMYKAVEDADPRHRIDVLSMATEVERVGIEGVWNAELGGFTNHGEALGRARELLEHEDADRRLVYLITDGLPEAYTDEDGEVVVDTPEVCMPYAREQAELLRDLAGTRLMVIQLEAEDELYVDAARELAQAAEGRVEALDPEQLTETVVLDFESFIGDASGV